MNFEYIQQGDNEMNFEYIQQWLDAVQAESFSDYEKIDIVITQLEDGTWRASLFNGKYQLLCNKGENTMCAEGATLDGTIAELDALCMQDIKDLA
jgi:hypothetical protein